MSESQTQEEPMEMDNKLDMESEKNSEMSKPEDTCSIKEEPLVNSSSEKQENINTNSQTSNAIEIKNFNSLNPKSDAKPTILNVQSVCPNVKPTVLKVTNDELAKKTPQTRTVLIVNRDGNKVTLAVSKQPIDGNDQNKEGNQSGDKDASETVTEQSSSSTSTTVTSTAGRTCI